MTTLVVHGHFYQPSRTNPFTGVDEPDPTAAPDRDWNTRINRECYLPNASNYKYMSFDVGGPLWNWALKYSPATCAAWNDAWENSVAHPPVHAILPLLPSWCQEELMFQAWADSLDCALPKRGIWFPETAVNTTVLDLAARAGFAYTILAPEQIKAVRPCDGDWRPLTDTGRLYKWVGPSGKPLTIVVFNGGISREAAFGNIVEKSEYFCDYAEFAARASEEKDPIVVCCSDGELYGHHRKHADRMLDWMFRVEAPRRGIRTATLNELVAERPPTWEIQVHENSSWSCGHGLGRWQRDCGCRFDCRTNQHWRSPLKEAVDYAASVFSWDYDRYMYCFTSCGWFFDDIDGIESRLVLRELAHMCSECRAEFHVISKLLAILSQAVSNRGKRGDQIFTEVLMENRCPR